ncbi:serine hydrolase domain-containing protein [Arsukibacterium indicum]|uniref:Beta-lactamase family protein n=1 Tax=Arsukibacterium indicum TaxID=2848612 RepID=A0ABS6MNW0_9GAMM|nr:serine hydrolase domain-containing protein [Arsukibacterium indicum]MBV2130483.1 beta-lactamase family protein [Arsukibacterium indicum]
MKNPNYISLCFTIFCWAWSLQTEAKTMTQTADKIAAIAPDLLQKHDVPSVAVALIGNGEIQSIQHFGYQTWGYKANTQTLYNVASLTKPVTAEIVLRLISQQKLQLDTKLASYFVDSDVKGDDRVSLLTPEVVMRHRTGFPNWRYETAGKLQFIAQPDTQTQYSGEGYEWMMKAVSAVMNTDFETLARTHLFEPAGMQFTSYTLTNDFIGRVAVPYKEGEAPYNVIRNKPSASDDLRTTVGEYATFMLSVFEGNAVATELRERQFKIEHTVRYRSACMATPLPDFCPQRQGWGLGWMIYDWGDMRLIEHSGGDHGERTLALYNPDAKRGLVVLTNGANGFEVIKAIAAEFEPDSRFKLFLASPFAE